MEHDKRKTYRNGCRCELCRSDNARKQREYLARRRDDSWKVARSCLKCRGLFTPSKRKQLYCSRDCEQTHIRDDLHGTRTNYGRGCRCDLCKHANTAGARAYKIANPKPTKTIVCRNPDCDKTFNTRKIKNYCSERCSRKHLRQLQVAERQSLISDQVCPVCFDVFRTDGAPGSNRLYCSKKCRMRAVNLSRKLHCSIDRFHEIMDHQDYRCAICGAQIGVFGSHVDHCHGSDHIRGILCRYCNIGLGHFRDDERTLKAAAAYLKANRQTRLTLPV